MSQSTSTQSAQTSEIEYDAFGRMESERTLVLSPNDMELLNREVEEGGHQTIDDALAFILSQGYLKTKNERIQKDKNRAKTELSKLMTKYALMVASNPTVAVNAKFQSDHKQQVDKLLARINAE